MKRSIVLLMIIVLQMSLNNGCTKSYDCYDCKKAVTPKRIDDLYNPSYNYQTVCSEEEAIELERDGWHCEDFQNPRDEICYSCKKYDYYTYKIVSIDTVCGDNLYDLKTSLGYKCTEIQH